MRSDLKFSRSGGFTLVELLVVVAIIALLISILLPSLSTARETARQVKCSSILKQYSTANHMYADDFENVFVPIHLETGPGYWDRQEWPGNAAYFDRMGVDINAAGLPDGLHCPNHPTDSVSWWNMYGMNWYGIDRGWSDHPQVHRTTVVSPARKVQTVDAADWHVPNAGRAHASSYWDQLGERGPTGSGYVAYRHFTGGANEGATVSHMDGHASFYTKDELYPSSTTEQELLWNLYNNP